MEKSFNPKLKKEMVYVKLNQKCCFGEKDIILRMKWTFGIKIEQLEFGSIIKDEEIKDQPFSLVTTEWFNEKYKYEQSNRLAIARLADKKAKQLEKNEEEKRIKTSLVDNAEFMAEEIVVYGLPKFAKYDKETKEIEIVNTIQHDGLEYYPIGDAEVINGQIKLPTNILEYGTEADLIKDLDVFITKYVDVSKEFRYYAILNILKSWVFQRFHTISYLKFQGEPGKGKSRALDVFGYLHYKPIATSGTVTSAPIYRLITKWNGTLIIDEADRRQSDEMDEVIKIINQGFEKGRSVLRCNPDDKSQVEFFETYSPKVLSTRHSFEDVATETRCMTEIMTGTSRKDIISSLNEKFWNEMEVLRNKLLLWRFHNYDEIDPNLGELEDWSGIEPRLKQVNVGFVALLHKDEKALADFFDSVRKRQDNITSERMETVEAHIIEAISYLLLESENPITAEDIINKANLVDKYGQKWKSRRLSSYMKTLGFGTTKLFRDGERVGKAYDLNFDVFARLFTQYLPKTMIQDWLTQAKPKTVSCNRLCNCVTVVTIVCEQGKTVTNPENTPKTQETAKSVTIEPYPYRMVTLVTQLQSISGTFKENNFYHSPTDAVNLLIGDERVGSLLADGTLKNMKAGYLSYEGLK